MQQERVIVSLIPQTVKTTKIIFASGDPDTTNPNMIEIQTGGDVVDDTSPQLGGNLDTNSFMIDFDDAHGIRDENGNEQLIFSTTSSSAVNVTLMLQVVIQKLQQVANVDAHQKDLVKSDR